MLLTCALAAKRLGRHPETVRRWIHQESIPGFGAVIGGRPYVREAVLDKLLDGSLQFPPDEAPTKAAS